MKSPRSAAEIAREIVADCSLILWQGTAWRFHQRKYDALDATGSRLYSGRYNRATDRFPVKRTWPALYLALNPETCIGEILRHLRPERLERLNELRLTEVAVTLSAVLDCREVTKRGIPNEALLGAFDFSLTHEIGAAAIAAGAEALLIPSATRLGDNLVVFPEQMRPGSEFTIIGSRDPVLYVER